MENLEPVSSMPYPIDRFLHSQFSIPGFPFPYRANTIGDRIFSSNHSQRDAKLSALIS
jgi:hypothetical protein